MFDYNLAMAGRPLAYLPVPVPFHSLYQVFHTQQFDL